MKSNLCVCLCGCCGGVVVGSKGSTQMRRVLILVSKIVQNLANELEFGDKEPYMMPFNRFIRDNIPHMKQFLTSISTVDVSTV